MTTRRATSDGTLSEIEGTLFSPLSHFISHLIKLIVCISLSGYSFSFNILKLAMKKGIYLKSQKLKIK